MAVAINNTDFRQRGYGSCQSLAVIDGMLKTREGKEYLENTMKQTPEGYEVYFPDREKVVITNEMLKDPKLVQGDTGIRVLEAATLEIHRRENSVPDPYKLYMGDEHKVYALNIKRDGENIQTIATSQFAENLVNQVQSRNALMTGSVSGDSEYKTATTLDGEVVQLPTQHMYNLAIEGQGNDRHVEFTNPWDTSKVMKLSYDEARRTFDNVNVSAMPDQEISIPENLRDAALSSERYADSKQNTSGLGGAYSVEDKPNLQNIVPQIISVAPQIGNEIRLGHELGQAANTAREQDAQAQAQALAQANAQAAAATQPKPAKPEIDPVASRNEVIDHMGKLRMDRSGDVNQVTKFRDLQKAALSGQGEFLSDEEKRTAQSFVETLPYKQQDAVMNLYDSGQGSAQDFRQLVRDMGNRLDQRQQAAVEYFTEKAGREGVTPDVQDRALKYAAASQSDLDRGKLINQMSAILPPEQAQLANSSAQTLDNTMSQVPQGQNPAPKNKLQETQEATMPQVATDNSYARGMAGISV